jgi:4-hydroxy-2-oxoheptanedioate aldolase
MEHTAVDWEKASTIFGIVAEAGCVPLCRVPDGTMENIKRALDAGAWGIVAPMVDTLEQAQLIVDSCYYPPFGRRSVGGGTHFLSLGTSDAEYKERANDAIACILMTESPQGLANAPAIYALPGVDAIFVGPNDFRAQMRRVLPDGRKPTAAEFEVAMTGVLAAGAATKAPVGIHTFSVEECKARVAEGFRFMALSSDAGFLAAAAGKAVADLGIQRRSTAPGGGAAAVGGAAVY